MDEWKLNGTVRYFFFNASLVVCTLSIVHIVCILELAKHAHQSTCICCTLDRGSLHLLHPAPPPPPPFAPAPIKTTTTAAGAALDDMQ